MASVVVVEAYVYWSLTGATGLGGATLGAAASQTREAEDPTGGTEAAEPIGSAFVHRATSESIVSNSTYLDNR